MSRPAVEWTLFRARRRLTEEYDELVSGARCLRIQAIIATAAARRLGARDTRRLARHLAALPAVPPRGARPPGWTAALARAARCASASPRRSPACCRSRPAPRRWPRRRDAGLGRAPACSPISSRAGWGKAAAAAAVLVAGVGRRRRDEGRRRCRAWSQPPAARATAKPASAPATRRVAVKPAVLGAAAPARFESAARRTRATASPRQGSKQTTAPHSTRPRRHAEHHGHRQPAAGKPKSVGVAVSARRPPRRAPSRTR